MIQVLQFEQKDNKPRLIGFNELTMEEGIVKDGNIVDTDAFNAILKKLFSEAQPNAIKVKELYVTIPYNLLYTFVEDFSHHSKQKSMEIAMTAKVKDHSPVLLSELSVDYASVNKGHTVSYAAYASPKKWQERLLKAVTKEGVDTIEFVPEPIANMALTGEYITDDFALFSCHNEQVSLSVFHNGLLYDTFYLGGFKSATKVNCTACYNAFKRSQRNFTTQFKKEFIQLFFSGFNKGQTKIIKNYFGEQKNPLQFINGTKSKLNEFLPYETEKAILFGLFNLISSRFVDVSG